MNRKMQKSAHKKRANYWGKLGIYKGPKPDISDALKNEVREKQNLRGPIKAACQNLTFAESGTKRYT